MAIDHPFQKKRKEGRAPKYNFIGMASLTWQENAVVLPFLK
jgi:hypothetical protein